MVLDVAREGLDEERVEAAIGVISMFNYFTRVADATGIEFDYLTPLPAFEPDRGQATVPRPSRATAARPSRSAAPGGAPGRARPREGRLLAAWESWRGYLLDAKAPVSQPERQLLAAVAAEETTDWAGAEELGRPEGPHDALLAGFARKLSREPWRMEADDLAKLRAAGYSEQALLHIIAVVAHQNADSRLAIGLAAVSVP